jgi:hypothetical protein
MLCGVCTVTWCQPESHGDDFHTSDSIPRDHFPLEYVTVIANAVKDWLDVFLKMNVYQTCWKAIILQTWNFIANLRKEIKRNNEYWLLNVDNWLIFHTVSTKHLEYGPTELQTAVIYDVYIYVLTRYFAIALMFYSYYLFYYLLIYSFIHHSFFFTCNMHQCRNYLSFFVCLFAYIQSKLISEHRIFFFV